MRVPGIKLSDSATSEAVIVDHGVVTANKFTAPESISEEFEIVQEATDFATKFAFEISKHRCFDRELDSLHDKVAF